MILLNDDELSHVPVVDEYLKWSLNPVWMKLKLKMCADVFSFCKVGSKLPSKKGKDCSGLVLVINEQHLDVLLFHLSKQNHAVNIRLNWAGSSLWSSSYSGFSHRFSDLPVGRPPPSTDWILEVLLLIFSPTNIRSLWTVRPPVVLIQTEMSQQLWDGIGWNVVQSQDGLWKGLVIVVLLVHRWVRFLSSCH